MPDPIFDHEKLDVYRLALEYGLTDRSRFFDIARGSALECAAIQDVLVVSGGINAAMGDPLKAKRK